MRLETEARGGLLSKEEKVPSMMCLQCVPTMCAFNDARSPSSMIASRPDTKIEARGLCCARWESRQTQDWLRFDYCCCSVNNVQPKNSILVPSIIWGGHECPELSFTFSKRLYFEYSKFSEFQDSTSASMQFRFNIPCQCQFFSVNSRG